MISLNQDSGPTFGSPVANYLGGYNSEIMQGLNLSLPVDNEIDLQKLYYDNDPVTLDMGKRLKDLDFNQS